MSETPKGVLELLEQLREERNELDLLIQGLEKRLGIVSEPIDAESGPGATPRIKVSIDSIPLGFFHGLTQADAAEKLLRLNPGNPLTTQEMLQSFRKSGMQVNPKNAVPILYTTLKRSDKFERVAGKKWGLSEWYPNRKRRGDENHDQ
jgi:hypothetical protein